MSKFCGLRSRCNIRILWQYVRPLILFFKLMLDRWGHLPIRNRYEIWANQTTGSIRLKTCLSNWNKNIRTLFIASLTPLISSIYCFKSRSRYSNTKVKQLCVWIISWRVTIFACFKPRSNETKVYFQIPYPKSRRVKIGRYQSREHFRAYDHFSWRTLNHMSDTGHFWP